MLDRVPEELRRNTLLFYPDRGERRTWLGDFSGAMADYEQTLALSTAERFHRSGPRTVRVKAACALARLVAKPGNSQRASELLTGALADARQLVKEFPDLHPSFLALSRVLSAQGDKAGALEAIDTMERIATRRQDAHEIANMREAKAAVLAELGDRAAAIAELRTVHAMGRAFGYGLRVKSEWETLREEPAFQQLMKDAEAQANAQPRPPRAQ